MLEGLGRARRLNRIFYNTEKHAESMLFVRTHNRKPTELAAHRHGK